MSKYRNFSLTAAFLVGFALPAVAAEINADTVVATVNGVDITVGQMILTREALPEQYRSLPDDVLYEGVLDQLIQQTVLSQSVPKENSNRVNIALENELRTLRAGEALDAAIASAITDDAVQAAYDEKYSNAEPTKEYNASHILVDTEDEAKAIRKELDEGAVFADLAKEKSTGPSGSNGGELGWFSKGMMVKEFEDVVLTLEKGQISDPVKTRFGWHVIILNDSRFKAAPPLEEVRAEIEAKLEQDAISGVIKALTEKATVVRTKDGSIPTSVLSDQSLITN